MNISALCIRRPVMTTLVMLAMLLFGTMAYLKLPVSALPSVDFPTIDVSASLPGARPETMASAVATPLEKNFSTIAGLTSMTSNSTLGGTRITLQFALNRNIDAAAQDVQAAISASLSKLPKDMQTPPTYRKVNPADDPILYLALYSTTLRISDVTDYALNRMAQRISMIDGVAQVQVYGEQKYTVRIQLDPEIMAARDVGVDEAAAAVRQGNVNLPVGIVAGQAREYTVQSAGKLEKAQAYRPLIVAWRNGSPIRLEDIASVTDSVAQPRRGNWFNNTPGVVLAVQRQPGANTVAVSEAVQKLMPEFRSQIPAAVNLDVLYDRAVTIKESIQDVEFTLVLTAALVILVIFLFLRNVTATILPGLALPLSLVGAFACMHLFNFSLNAISLMALTLALGFVVDDAIVVLENIFRHMEAGKPPLQAALDGSKEIVFTIVSMTISLAAVFIPILFMGGIVGRLFHEFAVTIAAAVLISGFVSLTLTPMLASKLFKSGPTQRHGRLYAWSERLFEGLRALYETTLRLSLRRHALTMLFSLALLVLTVALFTISPKGFLPGEDTGQLSVMTQADAGVAFPTMVARQQALMDIVAKDPDIRAFMSVVGAGGPNAASNNGRMRLALKPRDERRASADTILQRLRRQFARVPGIRSFVINPPPLNIGGRIAKGQYQYTLQSQQLDVLYRDTLLFEERLRTLPELSEVSSDLELKNPEVQLTIDRDKSSALGISAFAIEDALATAYGNRSISTIYADTDTFDVVMELAPEYQANPKALSLLHVRSAKGRLVPLESLTTHRLGVGPLSVNHAGQMPSATIAFNLAPGVSLSTALTAVENLARTTLSDGVTARFQGEAQAFQDSLRGLWLLLIISVAVIYIVLGILYESFIHPLTILSGLPSAGAGALIALWIFGMPLDLYGFVGIIMLIGIVKKNAIMMIDFALEAQRREGLAPAEAIFQGALIRFRPIMMTTMAALMGTLPIALGLGAGAESRRPLGIAVVGGLLVSQFLTLYFTPVYYIYFERIQQFFRPRHRESAAITPEAPTLPTEHQPAAKTV